MRFIRSTTKVLTLDWAMGLVLTLIVLFGYIFVIPPLSSLDLLAYDVFSSVKRAGNAGRVSVVVYDEKTVRRFGPPPALPSDTARVVDIISGEGAKAIGLEFLYTKKRDAAGRPTQEIVDYARELKVSKNKTIRSIGSKLENMADKAGNSEDILLRSTGLAHGVVLPVRPSTADNEKQARTKYLSRNTVTLPLRKANLKRDLTEFRNPYEIHLAQVPSLVNFAQPYAGLDRSARAMGHTGLYPDSDGVLRKEYLVAALDRGKQLPSFTLQVALAYLGKRVSALKPLYLETGLDGLMVDGVQIRTTPDYSMFMGRMKGLEVLSFIDIIDGNYRKDALKGRAVLIGYATDDTMQYQTAWGTKEAPVFIHAAAVENILSGSYLTRPGWLFGLEVVAILYFGVFIAFVLPRVRARIGLMIAAFSMLPWVAASSFMFIAQGYWLKLFAPVVLLALGYGGVLFRRLWAIRERAEAESVESLKMLGLSFQGQGMLDMAFEKFMRCPVQDRSVRELLYNLGLDFERKRMPGKAFSVYEHILKAGKFKDVHDRVARLRDADATGAFAPSPASRGGTMVITPGGEKPTLGRYEIVSELGRGAMGTVYLGRDPKINREVAIKTLSYEDVDPAELNDVKERFFREAAAAGKLSHPNIMTIYDAGEDHDMAYLAMELLSGEDLTSYCRKDNLLLQYEVLRIVADVARALDYAHEHGVVHRDIKPANIMLLEDGTVKVTDFGVARISGSSKTSTGIVLGTPGYMSPEQVTGQKVTGQSDLFSLGIVLYELLSGAKPFQGESVAAVMYNISKGNFTPLGDVTRGVPGCVKGIVKKLMTKGLTRRYRRGETVVLDAEACMKKL